MMITIITASILLNNMCPDVWCEGDFNYIIQVVNKNEIWVSTKDDGKERACIIRSKKEKALKSDWLTAMEVCDDWLRSEPHHMYNIQEIE